MKLMKEIGFRCFIIIVMLSLAFVAFDMSRPILLNDEEIVTQDVVNYIVHPFEEVFDETEADTDLPGKDYNFLLNILLPIVVYFASIAGFLYLLIEDFKLLRTFSRQNWLARYVWTLWIVILIGLTLIPIFFGMQMLMKGAVLAVIATAVFLIILAFLYRLSYKEKR